MNRIVKRIELSSKVFLLVIEAPLIAAERKPGQFVVVQTNTEFGERIPLTIADADADAGTITLVVQAIGKTTKGLTSMREGETVENLLGPLGSPTKIERLGTVVCVGGGIGTAPLFPIAEAMKRAGNRLIFIAGAKSENLLIMEERIRALADEFILCTDDGSKGRRGFVTEPLRELCSRDPKPDKVFAIGPAEMMKGCAAVTKPFAIPTTVSLNTIMIDGTGMCGGCRVSVGGKTKFVCVDGPEFDGHLVDFDNMILRMGTYRESEESDHSCLLDAKIAAFEKAQARAKDQGLWQDAARLLQRLGTSPDNSARISIPPQEMPVQDPHNRLNMHEVALGYFEEQVRLEALRCLQCRNAPCVEGCPVRIDIPSFIKEAAQGRYREALAIIRQSNLLPAVCGRVCPQESQCQKLCTVGKALKDPDKSVAIGRIERFVADWEREHKERAIPPVKASTGKRVAVIGSGPAGLTVAADLRKEGHSVTIFEAFQKAGGVLVYGIPEFRLPKSIVQDEVDLLLAMGVELKRNYLVGRTRKLQDLLEKDGFDAAFVGTGAGLPKFMNIEGENLVGVFAANEYLTRANLMKAADRENAETPLYPSRRVAVLGGGNVAMDSARMALRLGAESVSIFYRRTEKEMPARLEEIAHAKEEGIRFCLLANPKKILGDRNGCVRGMEILHYTLGEPDSSGRRSPVAIPGSEEIVEVDSVIVAIGNESNPLIKQTTPHLETDKWGRILVNDECRTSLERVYAGGDIVLGSATVTLAIGQGRVAAKAINELLSRSR